MTKREAIDILELNRPFAENELQQAIDMSIKALKNQIMPTFHNDTCDDYEEKE